MKEKGNERKKTEKGRDIFAEVWVQTRASDRMLGYKAGKGKRGNNISGAQ